MLSKIHYRNYPIAELAKDVTKEVLSVWQTAVPQFVHPIIPLFKNVQKRVRDLLEAAQITSHRLQATDARIKKLLQESTELFDLVLCK